MEPVSLLFASSQLSAATASMKMSFQSVHFLLFMPVVAVLFFYVPSKLKKPFLLLASYYFFLFAAPDYLPVLLMGTLFSYIAARLIGSRKTQQGKKAMLALGIGGMLAALSFFKFSAVFMPFLSPIMENSFIKWPENYFSAAKAMGLSYYTFTAIGYMIDVYRGKVQADKSLLTHALFLGFFPSISLGPISRAGDLIPQLNDVNRRFNRRDAAEGLRMMAVGYFKKLAVADTIAVFVNHVYGSSLANYSGFTLIAANIGFMLQLYFDFSGYSDMAIGCAKILGIKLPTNFNTPYFSTNISEFWSRWHMSLSSWLKDYLYIPLGGSRKGELRTYINLFIVFLLSGIWHGDTFNFVVWGALQAVFRICERLLHQFYRKPKANPGFAVIVGKRFVVLLLWTQSLIFFRVGLMRGMGVSDAVSAFMRQFNGFSLSNLWNTIFDSVYYGVYTLPIMVYAFILFTAFCLAAALAGDWVQYRKLEGRPLSTGFAMLKPAPRLLLYFMITLCCFAAFLLQNGGFGGANFIYGGF